MPHYTFAKLFLPLQQAAHSHSQIHRWSKGFVFAAAALSCTLAQAAAGRANYDADGDGLIEIYTLEDFLSIKDSFSSAKLYGENTGCSNGRCSGYELMADLDFATMPNAGNERIPFTLAGFTFDGNHHSIKNLSVSTNRGTYVGLFNTLSDSIIKNLLIENVYIKNTQLNYTGALAGLVTKSRIINVDVTGQVAGYHYTGGLVGVLSTSTVLNCHFSGTITALGVGGGLAKGGLIGSSDSSVIYASSSEGQFISPSQLNPNFELGGLIGVTWGREIVAASYARFTNHNVNIIGNFAAVPQLFVENSYALFDDLNPSAKTAAVIRFYSQGEAQPTKQSYIRTLSPDELKCPRSSWDERCSVPALFDGWDKYEDSIGQKVWDFGASGEYPKIRADLIFDLADSDNDGVVDVVDRFPKQAAAAVDADRDTKADFFAANCDQTCQQNSGLQLDDRLEYTPPTSGPAKPVAGALSIINLVCLMLGVGLFRRSVR